jgi:hypothetical protein
MRKVLGYCATSSWALLGFYRGINFYDYQHENRKKYNRTDIHLYSAKTIYGAFGTILYFTLFPLAISKEIYRIEVNMRCLENEKTSAYYNELL